MGKTYLDWEDVDYLWNDNPFTWEEVVLIDEISKFGGGMAAQQQLNSWVKNQPTEKKKKLIQLLCKVDSLQQKFEKVKPENIKLSVNDIKILIKEVDIKLNLEKIDV